jgi:hypothetical protein
MTIGKRTAHLKRRALSDPDDDRRPSIVERVCVARNFRTTGKS